MTTDELIATLSRSSEPARPSSFKTRVALALAGGLVLGLIALKVTLGFRPDIGVSAVTVAMKAGLSALIATFAGGLALTLLRPIDGGDTQLRRAMGPIVVLAFALLAIGAITLFTTSPGHKFEAFTGGGFPWCIFLIPLLGSPTAILLMGVIKDAAPTRLALAGASVGALSGGVGAMVYAMFCPVDSVTFVTVWYVAGIALASALGAWVGVKLLRW
jgi:hypothetical protein